MNASLARKQILIAGAAAVAPAVPPPAPRVYNPAWRGIVALGDVAALAIAFLISATVVRHVWGERPSLGACVVAALVLLLALAARGLHEKTYAIVRRDEIYYALAVTVLSGIVVVAGFLLVGTSWPTRLAVALGVLLSGVALGTVRYFVRRVAGEERLFVEPRIVSVSSESEAERRISDPSSENPPTHVVIEKPVTGGRLNELARTAARRGIVLVLASESCAPTLAVRGLCLDGSTVLEVGVPAIDARWSRVVKRAFDLLVACAALVLVAPILGFAALAIWLESGRPVFYRQPRVGRDGATFSILKLRSMQRDAESATGAVWAVDGDARVTRVGRILRRTSIDELPQLVNVLRGEMSVVGPRPERPVFVERFSREHPRYRERLLVAPGLTACSHLYMPRTMGTDAVGGRLDYDLFYIRNWSLAMDVALILKTAAEVVFHRAA
jgi:lipopolysaccharide/colanic/teichoic acid biosynthesis glycosyltransferase